nr:hypothetical protein [Tanacetum cinerariifolium]
KRIDLFNELEKNGLEKETEVEEEVAAGAEKPQGNASKTQEMNDKQKEFDALNLANPESLWRRELVALDEQLRLDGNYPSAKSYPEIAKEAPKKKAPAKRTAASPLPQRANKR